MLYFLQQLINGLTLGAMYGLIAIGYSMVYGIIGVGYSMVYGIIGGSVENPTIFAVNDPAWPALSYQKPSHGQPRSKSR